jgi:hypothetical protein
MKMFLIGIISTLMSIGLYLVILRAITMSMEKSETFGDRFVKLADSYDKVADTWEMELYGDGWSGFAGWDCGRADGIHRNVALVLIKKNREMASALRSEIPHQPGYDSTKYDAEHMPDRQREWEAWYEDFHKRAKIPPLKDLRKEKE